MADVLNDERIVIPGLHTTAPLERYFLLDPETLEGEERTIDITAERALVLEHLRDAVAPEALPYGLERLEDMLPYYLHPHSCLQVSTGELLISYKQAPYLRRFDLATGAHSRWQPSGYDDFCTTFGSTHCEVAPGVIGLVTTPTEQQYAGYRDKSLRLSPTIVTCDLESGEVDVVATLPAFVRDTVHELEHSEAGYFVAVDMGLEIDAARDEDVWAGGDAAAIGRYAQRRFPPSKLAVYGPEGAAVWEPPTPCPSHVDVDKLDPSIFYVSSNNISKRRNEIVVHGPGRIEKLRYRDGSLEHLAAFSHPELMRITTHQLFERDGRQLMAVTGYPNQLWIMSVEDLEVEQVIELYPAPALETPCAAARSGPAPLYLVVDAEGEHAVMTGASRAYRVSLSEGRVVAERQFCEPGTFAATAHCAIVSMGVPATAGSPATRDGEP